MARSFADVARIHETAGRFALAAILYSRAAREGHADEDRASLKAAALECIARTKHPASALDFGVLA